MAEANMQKQVFQAFEFIIRNAVQDAVNGLSKSDSKQFRAPATRKEVADFLKISLPTLDTLVKTGQLQSFRIGMNVRFNWEDVESFIKERGVNNANK